MRFIVLFLAISLYAQELAPLWIQDSWRSSRYPSTDWYTGFARDKINGSPNQAKFKAIEKDAQSKLTESIAVHISGGSAVEKTGTQYQSGKSHSEALGTNYKQVIKSASDAVLAKMETYSYFDKESGYIYGFSAVRKKDLAEFYSAKINGLHSFAETELSFASQLAEFGKKKSALNKIKTAEDSLSKAGYWENLLQAVTGATTHDRSAEILKKINSAKMNLENGTSLYLKISGSEQVADNLAAVLEEKGCDCSAAESEAEADYVITVKAKLSRCQQAQHEEVYCYTNANVVVRNSKTKKDVSVKISEEKDGWTNGNSEKATEESFKKLTGQIAQKLIKEIEK
ncbi:MAG: hypothetical protein FWC26_12455 [Fibromonadales bacterium]|nr:hypothetical protein [Fibromonadales bacterium]